MPRLGLWLGMLSFAVLLLVPAPDGMTVQAWRVAALGAWMIVWWITEPVPVAVTALLPLVVLPLLGAGTPAAAAAPYANPVIFLFLGGFLLAAALQRVGLHRRLALAIIAAVGTRPDRIVLGFLIATAAISMWVSNSATVVMVLPLATPVLELLRSGKEPSPDERPVEVALLLGIAYAASIGGLGTLIGTPPNALLAGFLAESHQIRLSFGRFMLVGVPLVVIAIPITWLLLTRVVFRVRGVDRPDVAATVTAQRQALGPFRREERLVGLVMASAALAWITQPLLERLLPGLSEAAIGVVAAIVLFIARRDDGGPVLDWRAAEDVPWGVLLLFGGGLSLAAAIQQTGLSAWLGGVLAGARALPLPIVILMVTTLVVFLTEFTSNTATAAAFLPLASSLAAAVGTDPLQLVVPAALASSVGFMMPVGTPPNALVYGTGRVTMGEMMRAGLLLNVVLICLVSAAGLWLVIPALRP